MRATILAGAAATLILVSMTACDVQSNSVVSNSTDVNQAGGEGHIATHVTQSEFVSLIKESDQPVVVDFWAPWCGPCLQLGPTIEEIAAEFEGRAKVVKVNVDNAQRISQEYNITGIPAILYFKNGEEVDRVVGLESRKVLTAKLEALF